MSIKIRKSERSLPLDYEAMERKIRFFTETLQTGYSDVEITDGVEELELPKGFYDLVMQLGLNPKHVFKMVMCDFLTRYHNGNNAYEQGILNRIKTCDSISKYDKERLLKVILGD